MLTIMQFVGKLRSLAAAFTAMDGDTAMFREAGEIIKAEAQSAMGTYRYGWPPLKGQTIARKATGDSPLVETGRMRGSIRVRVGKGQVDVYSNDPNFKWHEFGTSKMSARPVFSNAAQAKGYEAAMIIHKAVGVRIQSML